MRSCFYLAFNVTDLALTRRFYGEVLGCKEGRSGASWVDFDFFGHQLSMHLGEPFKTLEFVLAPQLRFEGEPGEQWTMFFCDPFGNPIEIKGFAALDTLYAA